MKTYRHGDVIIEWIDDDSNHGEELHRDGQGRLILAEGEVTGHAHAIRSKHARLFQAAVAGAMILKVAELCTLEHEEHSDLAIPPGTYSVRIKRQYNPETGWESVVD